MPYGRGILDRDAVAAEARLCRAVSTCGRDSSAEKEGARGGTTGSPTLRRGRDLNPRRTKPPETVFETAAFDRSATPPRALSAGYSVAAMETPPATLLQLGEVSEWSKERDWKSRTCCKVRRGFKSRPLR